MESQVFSPAAYSPDATYYLPPEDDAELDADHDDAWAEYAQLAATIPTDDLMLAVSEAFSDSDVLRRVIDEIKRSPFTPGERRHLHVSDCLALGDALAMLIDQAMDEAIGMRSAGRAA